MYFKYKMIKIGFFCSLGGQSLELGSKHTEIIHYGPNTGGDGSEEGYYQLASWMPPKGEVVFPYGAMKEVPECQFWCLTHATFVRLVWKFSSNLVLLKSRMTFVIVKREFTEISYKLLYIVIIEYLCWGLVVIFRI